MKDMGTVQGSYEASQPLVVGKTTVYVHDNIHEIQDEEGNTLYEYHEVQYPISEYIELLSKNQFKQGAYIDYIAMLEDIELPEEEEE